eukprot:1161046-Pelagomonas_calceolata.AAC.4
MQFAPYEDVLGLGNSDGYSSIIVPGARECVHACADLESLCLLKPSHAVLCRTRHAVLVQDLESPTLTPTWPTRMPACEKGGRARWPPCWTSCSPAPSCWIQTRLEGLYGTCKRLRVACAAMGTGEWKQVVRSSSTWERNGFVECTQEMIPQQDWGWSGAEGAPGGAAAEAGRGPSCKCCTPGCAEGGERQQGVCVCVPKLRMLHA